MSASADTKLLNKVYGQIVHGYTVCKWRKTKVFLKHFGVKEQFAVEQYHDEIFERARKQGLPTEEETLELLKKEGAWTAKEQREIEDQQSYVEGMRQSRKHLIIPSQIEALTKQLEEAEEELAKKELGKRALLKDTCESFADHRSNDQSVYLSFCRDEKLEPYFTKEEFDDLDKGELVELVSLYNEAMNSLEVEVIKKIALAPFFGNYFNLTGESPHTFFGKPIAELTYYQVNLLSYGRVFKSILENVPNIPDHVMDDPDKLLDFAESSKKTQASRDKAQEADGYSVVGATDQDLKTMGVKDPMSKSIFQMAKEKGGHLSLEDFK